MSEYIFRSVNDSHSLTSDIEDMCALTPVDWYGTLHEEIVRCRDCDSASFDEFGGGWCNENCREIKAWNFCAWGEKELENGIR